MQLQPVSDTLVPERLRRSFLTSLLQRGIHTEEELDLFVRAFLGISIPKHAVCQGHVAPWQFFTDIYFERHKTVLGFANRNGGKTLCVSALNVTEGLFKPGIEIVSAGAIRAQTDRGYRYVTDMLIRDPLLSEQVASYSLSKTILMNGSILQLVSGSYSGLNSPHPAKVRIDEVELMHWSVLGEGLQMSLSTGKWQANDCLTSTRKIASGTMQRLLNEAEQKHIQIDTWCIWEILERCTRLCHGDPVHGDCPAYSRKDADGREEKICGGFAHNLPEGGFYKIDDFIKKVSLLDADTFETQWLNLRPSSGSLVYGRYFKDEPPYVVPTAESEELLAMAKENKWQRVIAIDFGSNFYVIYLMQDPRDKTWYAYGEYWYSSEQDLPLKEHAKNLQDRDPLGWSNKTLVYADPSGRQAIRDLEGFGVFPVPANNDLYAGINHVKSLLQRRADGRPGLRVFHRCTRLRLEMGQLYVHPLDKNGEPMKDKVMKKDDHASDSLRYALVSYQTIGTTHYKMRRLRGVW